MLSDRGLQIIVKLADYNKKPVTSKFLAQELGVSERSVKTYIKEVLEYCNQNGMKLTAKPGKGFVADFLEEDLQRIRGLKDKTSSSMSARYRQCYIGFILLSGWELYTISLFAEELGVSKNVITYDIDSVERELKHFNIQLKKTAGKGVYVRGEEFQIRKALHRCMEFSWEEQPNEVCYDERIPAGESGMWISHFKRNNYEKAVRLMKSIEKCFNVIFTDYSCKMFVEYQTIAFYRMGMEKYIDKELIEDEIPTNLKNDYREIQEFILKYLEDETKNYHLTEKEKKRELEYVLVLLKCAGFQHNDDNVKELDDNSKEMIAYIEEMFGMDMEKNSLLKKSLMNFIPSSIERTRYGIEIINPFLKDITEMYSGIFATCFTLSTLYEKFTNQIQTNHEIAYVTLLVGGALRRNSQQAKAVLVGAGGIAAAGIIAANIESKLPNLQVIAILSSDKISKLEEYECDIILYVGDAGKENLPVDKRLLVITPMVTPIDVKNIKEKCFELAEGNVTERSEFLSLLSPDSISFVEGRYKKKDIIVMATEKMIEEGFVKSEFLDDIYAREHVEVTAIGNGVAIPHGKPENVISSQIRIIKLKRPVDWGNGHKVDLVFFLALNFDNFKKTKAFFKDFTRILNSKDGLSHIKESKNEQEFYARLIKELKWF